MSIYGNISMLGSALRTFQYGLDVASNNIANSMTVGYSRQVLNLEPNFPIADGRMQLGSGVGVQSIQRIRDMFLDSRIKFELSELGRSSIRQEALTELAAIFPEVASSSATNGLKGAIDGVVTAWTNLAAAPGSIPMKTAVRDALAKVADMLQLDARRTFDLQVKLDDQVKTTVTEINSLADQIANLNVQIKIGSGRGQGSAPGALLDLREQAAEKLARLIDAHFTIIGDGSMVVSFNGGMLADGTQAKHLALTSSTHDPGRTGVGYFETGQGNITDMTARIGGGKLGGLLQARDIDVEKARLDLNRMAFGIISRSNEINHTYVAADLTTGHDLFGGHSAADIVLDPLITAHPDYVGDTRDSDPLVTPPGDLARMQLQLKNFIQFSSMRTATGASLGGGFTVDPTQPLNTQTWAVGPTPTATPASQGEMVISTGGNAKTIKWDVTQTLNEIITNINTQGSGAFYATFDAATQQVILVGQTPLTVYDKDSTIGNLADVLMLSASVISSAPINNYPIYDVQHPADVFSPMNNTPNTLNLFTTPSSSGTIQIDGFNVSWTGTDEIMINVMNNITAATPVPERVTGFWNLASQTVQYEKSGDPGVNFGSHDFSGNMTGAQQAMTSIQVVDIVGNLSRTLNLDTDTNASKIFDEMTVALGAHRDTETVLAQQAQALVDQTQQLQDSESKVNLDQELALARTYQRSYEASVRLQGILDEMLNVLINHTGTASSSGSSL